ncbi:MULTISPECIES: hypothetical protein [unclassified Microbacterium]|uniref:hypothetical protein n=1 Tax=unclassified Microbacterium TaxID=2609290 RepID=UPI00300FC12A
MSVPEAIKLVAAAEGYKGLPPKEFAVVGDVPGAGGEAVTWATLTGKPATFPPTVGTTATTAKAGNYVPTSTEVGNALKAKAQVAALAAITVADATDEATAIALANATKATVNAIIAALKA